MEKLEFQNFISKKYQELREEEQLFFQAAPTMRVAKKLIQFAALPPAAAVAATHAPLVGPAVAGVVGQATHLMHSGIHGVAADQIAKNFAEIAGQIQPGWGRQSAFNAWANVRTADMLAKTDAWARPLSGFAAPTMIGKGIVDTSKLAISYARQGIPTVVARPVVHMWRMTNHYINRAKNWFEETLSKLPEQVQQNVRSAMETVQRRQATMAEAQNQASISTERDMERRDEYVKILSEQQNDPNLTYESIYEKIDAAPELGETYDKQVIYQALTKGKTLDEATAIISQGPNVAQMTEANFQDVSVPVYLTQTAESVEAQYKLDNPTPEVNQELTQEPEAQTVLEVNASVVNPSVELSTDAQQQYSQLLGEFEKNPDLTWEDIQSRLSENPTLLSELDQKVVAQAAVNGMDIEDVQKLVTTEANYDAFEQGAEVQNAPTSQDQYAELLSKALDEELTYADIQEYISEDPQLQEYYDELVVMQGQEEGMSEEEARAVVRNSSEPERAEPSQAPEAEAPKAKASESEDLDPLRMINEDIVEKLSRNIEIGNMRVFLNQKEIFRLNDDGIIDHNRSSVNLEQSRMIREALRNPEKFKGTLTIKVGTRTILRIQNGIAIPDRYGLSGKDIKAEADIPKDAQQQSETKGQKTEAEAPKPNDKEQSTEPENQQVASSQAKHPTGEVQDEFAGFTQEQKDTINRRREKGLDSSKLIAKIKKNLARPPVEKKEQPKREVTMSR
ncbi:hypothetical protein [Acaryochloris sp. CCMEE 5410]|uniref:hypothetical protein n=1 Tax=Acaryochloris sp. CCMEE 5410 TaxID=310037 RepID=UPI00024848F1|nr:hypothetical protein [Acaryochloris sp. CCMEE 5410]KAI9129219.1 hypothetical protein ON05_036025 [Acaryochloris sp. CCMEE 5410]